MTGRGLSCACGRTSTREGESHTPDGAVHRYSVCTPPPMGAGRVPSLPSGIGATAQPGYLYSPTVGQHAGHIVELVSRDGRSHTACDCQGEQAAHRANLVRCLDCLDSWAYRP